MNRDGVAIVEPEPNGGLQLTASSVESRDTNRLTIHADPSAFCRHSQSWRRSDRASLLRRLWYQVIENARLARRLRLIEVDARHRDKGTSLTARGVLALLCRALSA